MRPERSPLYPKILFGFTEHPITVWAGVILLRLYFEWIKLREELNEALVGFTKHSKIQIASVDVMLSWFNPVGFLPLKWQLQTRESIALLARHFGNALDLRKNHPRLVTEVYPLASLALEHCSVKPDAIVDEEAAAYPAGSVYTTQELTTEGYAALLRIERGRVRNREIFWAAASSLRSLFGPGAEVALCHCPRKRRHCRGRRVYSRPG